MTMLTAAAAVGADRRRQAAQPLVIEHFKVAVTGHAVEARAALARAAIITRAASASHGAGRVVMLHTKTSFQ